MKRFYTSHPAICAILISISSSLLTSIAFSITKPAYWFGALSYVVPLLLVFFILPQVATAGILDIIARHAKVNLPATKRWSPALLFLIPSIFGSFVMVTAFKMADNGQSGSEFLPLALFGLGISGFWIVPLITIVICTIHISKQKRQSIDPNQLPLNTPHQSINPEPSLHDTSVDQEKMT